MACDCSYQYYNKQSINLKPKDLIGIPWRVALALQADGWYLRTDIVWSKTNPMTESVSDRPSRSHEYLFLLAKKERYWYDAAAIREPAKYGRRDWKGDHFKNHDIRVGHKGTTTGGDPSAGRNCRTVWTISCRSFKGAHFATFPPKLVEPCILAGTSEKGCCPACGKGWVRVTEKSRRATRPGTDTKVNGLASDVIGNRDPLRHVTEVVTVGWEPACKCDAGEPVPCVVLDPFNGAGTSGLVALELGRRYVGVDLKPEYLAMSAERLAEEPKPARKPSARRRTAVMPLAGQGVLFDLGDERRRP